MEHGSRRKREWTTEGGLNVWWSGGPDVMHMEVGVDLQHDGRMTLRKLQQVGFTQYNPGNTRND